jgi:hypothetical protein
MASALSWWPWEEVVVYLELDAAAPLIKGRGRGFPRAITDGTELEAAVARGTTPLMAAQKRK